MDRLTFSLMMMAGAAQELTVSVNPEVVDFEGPDNPVVSGPVTCTAVGVDPFTYHWELVSGSPLVTPQNPDAAVTRFSTLLANVGASRSAVYRCVVTDASGQTANTDDVSITLTRGMDASVTPLNTTGSTASSSYTSPAYTCTVEGGTAPYVFIWRHVFGDTFTVDDQGAATTTFSVTGLTVGVEHRGSYHCEAYDANDNSVFSNTISIGVTRT